MEKQQPTVSVGIMSSDTIKVSFKGRFKIWGVINGDRIESERWVAGDRHVISGTDSGKVQFDSDLLPTGEWDELHFTPQEPDCAFTLEDVTIGVSFHWRRKENQTFKGELKLIYEHNAVTAINIVSVEDYLASVISSEMSATASLELLKTHAVISRSWLLAQIAHRSSASTGDPSLDVLGDASPVVKSSSSSDDELIRWWDHSDHINYDVCADDHCQRYQGITRATTAAVQQAIEATWGQVLMYGDELCDARFSKSCGGIFEEFENCWEDRHHPYLEARRDSKDEQNFPDLTHEEEAADWILSSPKAYCNTNDHSILSQVLNDYDQETADFYRWRVEYTQAQLADLIARRTGEDYGRIRDLQPVARGTSGRLYKLRIVGERRSRVIGKELAIRYALSESALYSSAFVVERHDIDAEGYPAKFVLHGAGWGHGVGLCQIGAAVMGARGCGYRDILAHYFAGAVIQKKY